MRKCKIRNTQYKMQNWKYKIQNRKYKIQIEEGKCGKKESEEMQRWGRKIQIRALFEFLFSRFIRFLLRVFSDKSSLTFLDFYNFSRCNRDSSDKSKYHLFINHQMCQGYAIFLVWVASYVFCMYVCWQCVYLCVFGHCNMYNQYAAKMQFCVF